MCDQCRVVDMAGDEGAMVQASGLQVGH